MSIYKPWIPEGYGQMTKRNNCFIMRRLETLLEKGARIHVSNYDTRLTYKK